MEFNEHWFKIYLYDYLYYTDQEKTKYNKLPEGFGLKNLYALYKGMISAVDDQVGQIIEMLDEAGIADNTIVMFVSDHGDNMGSHGHFNKNMTYEESIRVPFMVSWKGRIEPGVDDEHVVSLIDIAPTLLELLNLEIPGYFHGCSLKSLLTHESESFFNRDKVFIETTFGELGIRTNKYLYSVMSENHKGINRITDDKYMFFDLEDDPYQMNNLTNKDSFNSIGNKLKQDILEWNESSKWLQRTLLE